MTIRSIGRYSLKWLFLTLCLAIYFAGQASVKTSGEVPLTATKVFADAPLEMLDMIRPSTRLDMLDYYEQADSLLAVANALGGESRFLTVAPDYLKVQVTPVSTLEIKVLQAGKRQIAMSLYTVGNSDMAQDTEVRFFDSGLRPLDVRKYLMAPALKDFFSLQGSGLSESDLKEKAPFAAILYETGPGDAPLKATLTTLRALSDEDRALLTTFLTPTLTAPWKGKYRFK